MIKARAWKGILCVVLPPGGYHYALVEKAIKGKWHKRWNCITAALTSTNAANLFDVARENDLEVISDDTVRLIARPFDQEQRKALREEAENRLELVQNFGLKNRLWKHQREAFLELYGLTGAILDMGMGTGKSISTIAMILSGQHDTGIIFCPKAVIQVWKTEFKRHCAKDIEVYTGIERKGKPVKSASTKRYVEALLEKKNLAVAKGKPFICVCNYEKVATVGEMQDFLESQLLDFVVLDEVHRIKSQNGSASKFIASLRRNSKRMIGCTGTLLPHSPMDAFAIFRAIDPAVFGQYFIPFRSEYAILGGFEGKSVIGFTNQQKMSDLISSITFRVKSEDVLDLPQVQHIVRTCELDPKTRKIYDEMNKEMYVEYEEQELTAANAMTKVLRLQQITSGVIKNAEGKMVRVGREKAALFEDILDGIPIEEPVVVFCNFTADIEAIKEMATKQQRKVFELSGRENQLHNWQEGKEGVLAVQIKAGKEGVDFTNARINIYYSIGYSLGDYDQSLKRSHRPGQKRSVVYYHLIAKDTIDEVVYESLDSKRDIVEYVLETLARRK